MQWNTIVDLSEVEQTIKMQKNKGYKYLGLSDWKEDPMHERVIIFFDKPTLPKENKLQIANNKLEDYIKQQEKNELLSDFGKNLACNVIKQCQKIMNDIFETE